MQKLGNLLLNSLHGENIRTDFTEEYKSKPEYWMSTEFDGRVLDYWRLTNREYIVKSKEDDGLDCEKKLKTQRRPT